MSIKNEIKRKNLLWFKKFTEICKENDIWYSVFAGTMIGTIREKGNIPWDDDYDVMMTPESYNKLKKLYPKYCLDYKSNKKYQFLFNKFIPNLNDLYSNSIFIDIFIVIPTNKKNIKNFANTWNKFRYILTLAHGLLRLRAMGPKLLLFSIFTWPIHFFIRRTNYEQYIEQVKAENKNINMYFIIALPFKKEKLSYVKNMSYKIKFIDFEDFKVSIIVEYDELLTRIFGNYMKPVKFVSGHLNVIEKE